MSVSAALSDPHPLAFRHLWGVQGSLKDFFARLEASGLYQGIEAGLIWLSPSQKNDLQAYLKRNGAPFIGMIFTDTPFEQSFDWRVHVENFKCQLESLWELVPTPRLINVHGGRDFFSAEDEVKYFQAVTAFTRNLGVPVVHETHRGRILFHPKRTVELLAQFPELHLCLDVSHWLCSSERLLNHAYDNSWWPLVLEKTLHLHTRIGYEEGPQVPYPTHPDWTLQREFCDQLWRQVASIRSQRNEGLSFTPEYGPFPYATREVDAIINQNQHQLEVLIDEETKRLRANFARPFTAVSAT